MADNEDRFSTARNFLATDEVPETLFGIPVVADEGGWTERDIEFFREHPEAGGYYDMGDEEEEPPEEPVGEQPMQAASKGGNAWTWETYRWNPDRGRIDPKNIKGTGIAFDAEKSRLKVPKGREGEFEEFMDGLAKLYNPVVWDEENNRPVLKDDGKTYLGRDPSRPASNLVPPNWREEQGKGRFDADYDYVAAFLAGARPGVNPGDGAWHMGDAGKMPTHPTFSNESYYARDSKYAPLAGSWKGETYIPGTAESGLRQSAGAYPGSLNNPGNVEKRAERRQGETDSPHERWAMFSTPQDGLYAMADSIRQIADVKLAGKPFTIRSLSEIYAPRKNKAGAKENDTAKYIRNISRYSGIDADAELDRWNPGDMSRLLKTMVRFESGKPHSDWFTDDEYGRAAEILQEGAAD